MNGWGIGWYGVDLWMDGLIEGWMEGWDMDGCYLNAIFMKCTEYGRHFQLYMIRDLFFPHMNCLFHLK